MKLPAALVPAVRSHCPTVRGKRSGMRAQALSVAGAMSASIRQPLSRIALFIVSCCCCIQLTGQHRNIGPLISVQHIPGGIVGRTATAQIDIRAYNPHVIRVRVTQDKTFRNFSYALVSNELPAFKDITVTRTGGVIILSTAALKVLIEEKPAFRVTFSTLQGTVLNEDVPGEGFGTVFNGNRVTVYKQLQEGERFTGLGEALGNLDRRGTGITLNNTDTYKYGDPRLAMYSSIPFFTGIHHQQVYGMFFNNSFPAFFNFGLSTRFTSVHFEGGELDYFFIHDQSPTKVLEHYTALTGRMPMPPLWSLGYQQSRCSYFPQDQVLWIAETFRRKKIPLDGLVLDADYQLGYQPFRINKQRFPDLPALSKQLKSLGVELTASIYPGVKTDSTYDSYREGLQQDLFLKHADGSVFKTAIAPLDIHLPDYTNPRVRSWWSHKMKWLEDNGIRGYWNDMNEPAVGGSYLPENLVFNFDGHAAGALEAKNIYGMQMARSTYEGALQHNNGHRPFVLTRSGFAGVQRYSALWSGDNTSTDEGMLSSVLLNNQLGKSGMAFCGYDVGGYIGDASKDLYKRWIQLGIFSPYCRNHREFFGAAGEPWAYGEEAEVISRNYINWRYRLLPYLYSAVYEATQTGMPIARSLSLGWPYEDKVYDPVYQYQFLFGDALLVAPVTSLERSKKIFLPPGTWYNLHNGEQLQGPAEITVSAPVYEIPLFVKGSAIIPQQSLVQSTAEKPSDTLVLHLYAGKNDHPFVYYEDDGDGMQYHQGRYCKRKIRLEPAARRLVLEKQKGSYPSRFRYLRLVFHAWQESLDRVRVNGSETQAAEPSQERLFNAVEGLEAIYDPGYYQSILFGRRQETMQTVTLDHRSDEMIVQW